MRKSDLIFCLVFIIHLGAVTLTAQEDVEIQSNKGLIEELKLYFSIKENGDSQKKFQNNFVRKTQINKYLQNNGGLKLLLKTSKDNPAIVSKVISNSNFDGFNASPYDNASDKIFCNIVTNIATEIKKDDSERKKYILYTLLNYSAWTKYALKLFEETIAKYPFPTFEKIKSEKPYIDYSKVLKRMQYAVSTYRDMASLEKSNLKKWQAYKCCYWEIINSIEKKETERIRNKYLNKDLSDEEIEEKVKSDEAFSDLGNFINKAYTDNNLDLVKTFNQITKNKRKPINFDIENFILNLAQNGANSNRVGFSGELLNEDNSKKNTPYDQISLVDQNGFLRYIILYKDKNRKISETGKYSYPFFQTKNDQFSLYSGKIVSIKYQGDTPVSILCSKF